MSKLSVISEAILGNNAFILEHFPSLNIDIKMDMAMVGTFELFDGVIVRDPSYIQYAAIHGKAESLKALLDCGFKDGKPIKEMLDPRHSNTKLNVLALCVLSKEETAIPCLEKLLDWLDERRADKDDVPDVDFGGDRNRTALSEAVLHGRKEFVELLIKRGACPLYGKGSMPCPLVVAALRDNEEAGGDPDLWKIMCKWISDNKDATIQLNGKPFGVRDLLKKDKVWNKDTYLFDPESDHDGFLEMFDSKRSEEILRLLGGESIIIEDLPAELRNSEPRPEPHPAPKTKSNCCETCKCEDADMFCELCHKHFCPDHWERHSHKK